MSSTALFKRIVQLPPSLRRACFATASSASNPEVYDVVCVGGGPAGLSLISSLRSHPSTQRVKIALIDSQDLTSSRPTTPPESYSNRCSSLTPASLTFLKKNGASDKVDLKRTQNYHGMHIWDGVSGSKISFDPLDASKGGIGGGMLDSIGDMIPGSRFRESRRRDDIGTEEGVVATMCENSNLSSAFFQRLQDTQGVEILDKTKVSSIDLGPEASASDETTPDFSLWPIITLPNSRQLAARLLVGADGANSPVRNFADIASDGWDYNQHGVVATLNLDRTFSDEEMRIAYQRFLPTGPIALLPLPGNKASLVWSLTTPLATKLKSLPPADLTQMINAAFRLQITDLSYLLTHAGQVDVSDELSWRLTNTPSTSTGLPTSFPKVMAVQEGSTASFPLRMRHAATYTGHRVALIGDAAHTIHPLAGQGLNLGLADAEALSNQILYGVEHGMDIGSSWCLDGYNAERWSENNAVMGVCDKLQKIYSAESGPIVWGRSLGLEVIDRLGPLKGAVMGAAGTR